jgi:predicted ATPase with chaperone activity
VNSDGEILAKSFPTGERLANSMLCPSGFPELAAMALRLEHRAIPDDRIEMLRTAFSTTSLLVARGLSIEKTALQVFLDQSSNEGIKFESLIPRALDLGRIRGQQRAKEAACIAAAGGHNMLTLWSISPRDGDVSVTRGWS